MTETDAERRAFEVEALVAVQQFLQDNINATLSAKADKDGFVMINADGLVEMLAKLGNGLTEAVQRVWHLEDGLLTLLDKDERNDSFRDAYEVGWGDGIREVKHFSRQVLDGPEESAG